MPNIGPMELIVVLVVALIFLGPKRLPEMGRSLGKGLREFKTSVTGEDDRHQDEAPTVRRQELPPAAPPAAPVAPTATQVTGSRPGSGTPR